MELDDQPASALAAELEEVALQLASLDPSTAWPALSEMVAEEYERAVMAAALLDLPILAEVLTWAKQQLSHASAEALFQQGSLHSWLEITALILREPEESEHLPLLVGELMNEAWPEPLPAEQLQALLMGLRHFAAPAVQSVEPVTAVTETAALDNRRLAFASDVHPELLAAYREETPGQVSEAARLLRLLATGGGNREQQRHASRLVHTLKGSSGVVGITPIVRFAHDLESLLDSPLHTVPEGLGATLAVAADVLEALFEHLHQQKALPDDYDEVLVDIQHWTEVLSQVDDLEERPIERGMSALEALSSVVGAAKEETTELPAFNPVQASLTEERIQRLLNLVGELITSTSQMAESLQQTNALGRQLYRQDEGLRERLEELDRVITMQERQSQTLQAQPQASGQNTPQKNFDALELEAYSELHSTGNLLTEAAADSRELAQSIQAQLRRLTDELYQQQRIQRQLSDAVLATRLMSVGSLTARLERIVRETCRKTGKQADIEIQGQQLQVDTDILKGLTEPLLHLLRNAVDHGIETPEQRRAANKPETGKIRLTVSQRGNHVTWLLEDDGAGMDVERIRERAIQRGLIQATDALSEEAILRLILQPSFSTRDEVSEVSGRGVGMDVVQVAIQRLRGTLQVATQLGQGSRIRIDLPQTLIATHALVVRTSGHLVAIPADQIEQLLYVAPNEFEHTDTGLRIATARYQVPILPLAHLLHWPSRTKVDLTQAQTVLLLRSEQQVHAFFVDEILPSRDIVIKNLSPWLHQLPGIQGASILANGAVAPVLDMIRLLQDLENGLLQPGTEDQRESAPLVQSRATILVVDDSLSNRQAVRLMLESMDYVVQTAVDGLDALQVLNTQAIDLVLTDLEMPRMNGLELTEAIRIWPQLKHMPVVMLTSRGTRKHREQASQTGVDAYLTKPVQSHQLQQTLQQWLGKAV